MSIRTTLFVLIMMLSAGSAHAMYFPIASGNSGIVTVADEPEENAAIEGEQNKQASPEPMGYWEKDAKPSAEKRAPVLPTDGSPQGPSYQTGDN